MELLFIFLSSVIVVFMGMMFFGVWWFSGLVEIVISFGVLVGEIRLFIIVLFCFSSVWLVFMLVNIWLICCGCI